MKLLQNAFRILSSHWIFQGREVIKHFNWHSLTLGLGGCAGHCWEMYWSANIFAGTSFVFPACLKHFVTALVFCLCCQRLPSTPLTHKEMVFHPCKVNMNVHLIKWMRMLASGIFCSPVLLLLTLCAHVFSVDYLMLCSKKKYFSLLPLNLIWCLGV